MTSAYGFKANPRICVGFYSSFSSSVSGSSGAGLATRFFLGFSTRPSLLAGFHVGGLPVLGAVGIFVGLPFGGGGVIWCWNNVCQFSKSSAS